MRKLFRMKYEPCFGRCYAPSDVFRMSGFGASVTDMAALLDKLVKIHEPACGNEHLAYGLDVDEESGTFIASFVHYGQLELFIGATAFSALNQLADAALTYFEGDAYREAVAAQPGKGHDVCEHGKDRDLRHFALQHSGLPADIRAQLLESSV